MRPEPEAKAALSDTGPVLLVDDEEDLRIAGAQALTLAGLSVETLADGHSALQRISAEFPGILLTDIRMRPMDGLSLMAEALARDPDLPVILITGHGDVDLAVSSLKAGAYDFIEKPYAPARLTEAVWRALEKRSLTMELRALRAAQAGAAEDGNDPIGRRLMGRSAAMGRLREQLRRLAAAPTDLTIEGATGTGKEEAARALHEASERADRPFVAIDCAALPEASAESELFGHMQGAFPGATRERRGKLEHARGGTLYLDQVEMLPLSVQGKLARALSTRSLTPVGGSDPVALEMRVIAGTPHPLRDAVAAGDFREDLFYLLSVVTVQMPPLSERREDIPALYQIFLAQASSRQGRPVPPITPATLGALAAEPWRGNLRELRAAAERAVLGLDPGVEDHGDHASPASLADRMAAHERALIAAALAAHGGAINPTYEALGISRKALYDKMQKHGLKRESFRQS